VQRKPYGALASPQKGYDGWRDKKLCSNAARKGAGGGTRKHVYRHLFGQ